jgi:hypothetical protein
MLSDGMKNNKSFSLTEQKQSATQIYILGVSMQA